MNQYSQKPITEFRGQYYFLSNFYPAPISYNGLIYANNEAAFQAQKTTCMRERQQFSLPHLSDPARAKSMGRKLRLRPDWENQKLRSMYEICLNKFLQHQDLKALLIATGDNILIEGNSWGDRYWGMVNGIGNNHLGKILMDIREKLKNEEKESLKFQYQMLARLKSDCDYYLGYGNRNADKLWWKNEKNQIEAMKAIWQSFPEHQKPKWLTWEQIIEYKNAMYQNATE